MIEQLAWGLQITVVGMGLVFGLLALLWGLLTLVLRLDRPPAPAADESVPDAPEGDAIEPVTDAPIAAEVRADAAAQAASSGGLAPELLAAITVAVVTHRAQRRRQAAPVMRSYWPGSLLYASRWVGTGRARQNFYWRRRGR